MQKEDHLTDLELIPLLTIGDEQAFATIYGLYAKPLFAFIRKNIASKEDCEEIIQDVFESLWNRRAALAHITSLQAYLYQAVRYKIIRYHQHQKVKQKYADDFRLFEAAYEAIPEFDRSVSAIQHQIEQGISALPERCQQALKLRLHEDLSNEDIAKRMNIKKTTVENYMVKAIQHLRTTYPKLSETG